MPFIDESMLDAPTDQMGGSFVPEDALDPVPTPGQKFVGGISKLIPFKLGDELAAAASTFADPQVRSQSFGARAMEQALGQRQGKDFSEVYPQRLEEVRRAQAAFQTEHPALGTTSDVLGLFTAPLLNLVGKVGNTAGGLFTNAINVLKKTGAAFVEGAAMGGAVGFGGAEGGFDQRLAAANQAAETGAKFGAAIGAPLAAASVFAPVISAAGKALQRSSTGARGSDYAKKLEDLGVWDVVDDTIQSPVKTALDDLMGRNALGRSVDPEKMLAKVVTEQSRLGQEVRQVLRTAEQSLPGKITPKFNKAEAYLNSGFVTGDLADAYRARLAAIKQGIKDGPGGLTYLQNQKQALSGLYEVGNDISNGFNRALYQDIQLALERIAPAVRPLNRELAKYNIIRPIIERATGAENAKNIFSSAIQKLRTSGGTLTTPTLIGTSLGGAAGGPPGLALGAVLGAASSPAGRKSIGGILRQADTAVLSGAADRAAGLAGSLSGRNPDFDKSRRAIQSRNLSADSESASVSPSIFSKNQSIFQKNNFSIPDNIMDAVKKQESGGNQNAVSSVGAKGPYQLMDATGKAYHKKLGIKEQYNPFDEKQSRKIAKAFLEDMLREANGDLNKALLFYHTGIGNVAKGNIGPEGRKYARSVLEKVT